MVAGISGYVAANMYKKMGGENWVWNINLTSALFAGLQSSYEPVFILFEGVLVRSLDKSVYFEFVVFIPDSILHAMTYNLIHLMVFLFSDVLYTFYELK